MADGIPTPEGAVLRFHRFSKGVSEEGLASMVGVTPHTIGRWENGDLPLSRERLAEILDQHLGVSREAMDEALYAHHLGNLPEEPASMAALPEAESRLIGQAAVAGSRAGSEAARRELTIERLRRRAERHAAWAAGVWSSIKGLPARQQSAVLRVLQGDERSWALAVRLCAASTDAAAHRASEALRLARLAVSLAEKDLGPEKWRLRLLGFCEPFVANALRVAGKLAAAGQAFARADALWDQGKGADPAGLLDGARRLDLKASLLRLTGRFAEAQDLLDRALAISPPEAAAPLLIQKATTYTRAGDYELALEVLRQAESRIGDEREPRLVFLCNFSRAVALCHLDRYDQAERLLPLVETLAADLRTALDGVRTLWLKGRTLAGLGRREEAIAALIQVRRYFLAQEMAFDFAVVSVELATLFLEQGRTRLVKEIAEEMLWIFQGERVHQEALAALALFCQTIETEEAQAEWTRRLVKYLYRAQGNPSLRFEP